eukprot:1612082-Alexandrium_andersonii.AAC.1
MSASLVGSEMCIRDSSLHLPRKSRISHGSRNGLPAKQYPSLGWDEPGPVSYTHLTLPTICSV